MIDTQPALWGNPVSEHGSIGSEQSPRLRGFDFHIIHLRFLLSRWLLFHLLLRLIRVETRPATVLPDRKTRLAHPGSTRDTPASGAFVDIADSELARLTLHETARRRTPAEETPAPPTLVQDVGLSIAQPTPTNRLHLSFCHGVRRWWMVQQRFLS